MPRSLFDIFTYANELENNGENRKTKKKISFKYSYTVVCHHLSLNIPITQTQRMVSTVDRLESSAYFVESHLYRICDAMVLYKNINSQ